MRRGTTPTLTITTDIDLTAAENMFITFKQRNRIVFEKTLEDLDITGNTIVCKLTQDDTLALMADIVRFQIRATLADSSKVASNIMVTNADEILKGGAI